MGKKRSIISYEKLSIDQKKQILRDFPDGYGNHLTQVTGVNGQVQDALIWETEEFIYLVKIPKSMTKTIDDDDDDDDFEDLEIDKISDIKDDDDEVDSDDDDDYDEPADESEEDEDED